MAVALACDEKKKTCLRFSAIITGASKAAARSFWLVMVVAWIVDNRTTHFVNIAGEILSKTLHFADCMVL